MNIYKKYMKKAIKQAKKAYNINEVPIGCIITYNKKIIASGYNNRNICKSTVAHAEINVIQKANKKLGDWRLNNCTLYVTMEPCQMCTGAIIQARIKKVIIGTINYNIKYINQISNLYKHNIKVKYGIIKNECSDIISKFFKKIRKNK